MQLVSTFCHENQLGIFAEGFSSWQTKSGMGQNRNGREDQSGPEHDDGALLYTIRFRAR